MTDHVHALEPRRLLATTMPSFTTIPVFGRPLEVLGTPGNDVIEITSEGTGDARQLRVTLNGKSETHHASAFTRLVVYAGRGNDRVVDRSGYLGSTIVGDAPVVIYGGAGNDRIDTYSPKAIVYGDAGNDSLVMKHATGARLAGGRGNDTLYGSERGDDSLFGGAGRDVIDGRGGAGDVYTNGVAGDHASGSGGPRYGLPFAAPLFVTLDDVANDGAAGERDNVRGREVFVGSPLADVLDFSGAPRGVTLLVDYNSGADSIVGSAFDDSLGVGFRAGGGRGATIRGGAGDDTIDVAAGDDLVYGEGGDDTIFDFDSGDDRHDGGSGDDRIADEGGDDTIIGGAGKDVVYNLGSGRDDLRGGSSYDTLYSRRTSGVSDDLISGFEQRFDEPR